METVKKSPADHYNPAEEIQKLQYKNNDFISLLKNDLKINTEQFEANIGLFCALPANKWIEQAAKRPIPKMLFSEFWFENEICILFADTNVGKSILAVQIAESISNGISIPGFKLEAKAQKVIYFDFELTDKQFENRYSVNFANHYHFADNLIRIEINPDPDIPDGMPFETYLNQSIEQAIVQTGACILIIDNITYLRQENEKARDALPLMKELKMLKNKYNLSLLILAHTPKRDMSKPLTRNDLQGSKMLINFCDSSFAIGESSTDKSLRYLKMIKARSSELLYDADNVLVCRICKPENFLKFEFLNFDYENNHLRIPSDNDKKQLEDQIAALMADNPDASSYAIAKRLCTDDAKFNSFKVKVNRIFRRLQNS